MQIKDDTNLIPKKRKSNGWKRRLTVTLKNAVDHLEFGDDLILTRPEANCVRDYLRRNGFDATQRKHGNKVRIWKIK